MSLFRKAGRTEDRSSSTPQDLGALQARIEQASLPEAVAAVAVKEMERLEKTEASSPEYLIGLGYLEFILALPWNQFSDDNLDLERAQAILEGQHHGLAHVKERILEFLAVRTLCSLRDFHILVVDDEPIARSNMEHILKKENYHVATAGNGLEALNLMQRQEFDLVLTDLKMEKMDGLQLLEKARNLAPHTDFVMITGYATVSTAVDALKKGAVNYLPKPLDLSELRTIVRQIREKKRHFHMRRSPVLCFAGPPGTGKTSIGRSIGEALQRKFVRVSLAGLHDEAELRGHRRTYVGAMPGRLMNEIKRAQTQNPVFMLDEIDKIGQDFRGDPAAVLLEILDPEQNSRFNDHYLDLPFDLSAVLFIATANDVERLPAPLLDRLEILRFHGYTEREKENIARSYIVPRQLHDHGLATLGVDFSPQAIKRIIRDYTREAGLRGMEREVAAVCRKLARLCLQNKNAAPASLTVDGEMVQRLLGPPRFTRQAADDENRVGVATGLVWTEFGGEIISVEAARMRGSQQLILTGSLGAILRESAQTALSYIRSNAATFGIDPDFFRNSDIHVHIPAGAIPKDGPSAGITIALALISLLTGRPVRRDAALTGELTLSGRILPVAGIREKVLAAQRAGIERVVFPKSNRTEIESLEADTTEGVRLLMADRIDNLIEELLLPKTTSD